MYEKFGRWFYKAFPKLEGASLLLVIAGVVGQKFGLTFSPFILLVGLGTLALAYLMIVFLPPSKPSHWILKSFHRTFPIGCAAMINGILFVAMNYPGASLWLMVGVITLLLSLIGYGYLKWIKSMDLPFYDSLALRGLLLLGVGIALHQGWLGI